MAREIKFRVWTMTYSPEQHCSTLQPHIEGFDKNNDYTAMKMGLDRKALEQYTSLKDKNGVEIYEGDIVLRHGERLPITVDEFHGLRFMRGLDQLTKGDGEYGEVIGNIHENPELLEATHGTNT